MDKKIDLKQKKIEFSLTWVKNPCFSFDFDDVHDLVLQTFDF